MATRKQIEDALIAADRAGNVEDARRLAQALREMPPERMSRPAAAGLALGDLLTANTLDEVAGLFGGTARTLGQALRGDRAAQTRALTGLAMGSSPAFGLGAIQGLSAAAEPQARAEAEAQVRELQQQAREDRPATYYGAQIAGSLVPVLGQAGRAGQAARAAGAAGQAVAAPTAREGARRLAQNVALGAGTGALYAAGDAPEEDRLRAALTGGAIGGVAGPAIGALAAPVLASQPAQAVGRAIAGAGERVGQVARGMMTRNPNVLGSNFGNLAGGPPIPPPPLAGPTPPTGPQQRAVRQLVRGMRADEMTPQQLQAEAAALQTEGLGDVARVGTLGGPSMAETWRSFGLVRGPTRGMTETALEQIRSGVVDRMRDLGRRALNPSGRGRVETLQELADQKATQAAPLYRKADATPVSGDLLNEANFIAGTDYGREALRRARAIAQVDQVTLPPAEGGAFNFASLRYIREGLDDMIGKEKDAFGRLSTEGAAIVRLRQRLDKALKDASPDLKQADRIYAGAARQEEALLAGQRVFSKDAEETASDLAKMSEVERAAYRRGVFQAVMDRVMGAGDAPTTDATRKIAGNALLRARLRPAFDTQDEFDGFMQAIQREVDFVERARAVDPNFGSTTVPKLMGLIDTFADMASGDPLSPIRRGIAQRVGTAAQELLGAGPANPQVNRAMGDILTRPVGQAADVQQMIMDEYLRQLATEEARRQAARGASTIGGTQTGGMQNR